LRVNARFLAAGDTGLVVEFGDRVDRELSDRVLRLSASVRASKMPGVIETVPTYRSLLVLYDPLAIESATLISSIEKLLDDSGGASAAGRTWRIPACYEAAYAPDLADVAERTRRSTEEIVRLHSETLFHVYMIGFAPGLPYLGDLPDWIALPRRADPRVRVPVGSIGSAGNMSVIYPAETPGGWHLIGMAPIRLFDLKWTQPALLQAGDKVRFEPITVDEFAVIRKAVEAGDYQVPYETIG
jgi:inhibitor of KinA